ncbi:uncharacterized protein LOC128819666 [Vidua macroura]|uniref:uncharacterized protein LOC128819666 n=1 Tax=Vidua macroura TaxID=187451 RepID=UPI0023A7ABE3|nr:uncharacterized protein LOC128819666 [Vidua macroura]
MRRCRGAGLAALAAVLLGAVARAQVEQEASLETTECIGINITCSHPKIQASDWIQWYRLLPGQGPELLALTMKDSKELPDSSGQLRVSADRRWSALWLGRPRRGDAAVYYCALGATGRGAGAAAGHEPPRAGPAGASRGRCRSARRAPLCPAAPSSAPSPHAPTPHSPARPRTRLTTRLQPALAHSPHTARPPLAPEPAAASHQTAAACASVDKKQQSHLDV